MLTFAAIVFAVFLLPLLYLHLQLALALATPVPASATTPPGRRLPQRRPTELGPVSQVPLGV